MANMRDGLQMVYSNGSAVMETWAETDQSKALVAAERAAATRFLKEKLQANVHSAPMGARDNDATDLLRQLKEVTASPWS